MTEHLSRRTRNDLLLCEKIAPNGNVRPVIDQAQVGTIERDLAQCSCASADFSFELRRYVHVNQGFRLRSLNYYESERRGKRVRVGRFIFFRLTRRRWDAFGKTK